MRRDVFAAALELALMEESQTGREKRDHRRRAMLRGVKRRGSARLVVVFEKPSQAILVVEASQNSSEQP